MGKTLQDILGCAVQSKCIPTKQRGKEEMRVKSIPESLSWPLCVKGVFNKTDTEIFIEKLYHFILLWSDCLEYNSIFVYVHSVLLSL